MFDKHFSSNKIKNHHDPGSENFSKSIPNIQKFNHYPHNSVIDNESQYTQEYKQIHSREGIMVWGRDENPFDRNNIIKNDGYTESYSSGGEVIQCKKFGEYNKCSVVNDKSYPPCDKESNYLHSETAGRCDGLGGEHISKNKQKTIAVLIPCWNESTTIQKVVQDFKEALPDAIIYVYDNNSTDGTAQLAMKAGAIVRNEHRQGKGNVMRTMFREIDADCYVLVDGDDTYPAEFAPEMVSQILNKNIDMVLGDRLSSTYFVENKRLFHNSGNVLVRKLINLLFLKGREPVLDIMTGYRAFSPLFVKSFPILSRGFEVETEMTIHALDKNLGIKSIPVTYRDRPEGSFSKLSTFRDGIKVLWTIFILFKDYRPMLFFSIVSSILFSIGVVFLIPVLDEYLKTGLVPRLPTFIAACFLALFALLIFVCGLILDTITKKDKQTFEINLNIMHELYCGGIKNER